MSISKEIIVIGAGVIGLQTALTLLEADQGYRVTVVAEHLPGDEHEHYTSPWAGAIWRTHASADQTEVCGWDAETYKYWKDLVEREEKEGRQGEAGIKLLPATQYWDVIVPEIENGISSIWWAYVVTSLSEIPKSSLPAGSIFGVTYVTFAVNVPQYLSWLSSRITSLGGRVQRLSIPRTTPDLASVVSLASSAISDPSPSSPPPLATINATGLGAKWLAHDPAVDVVQGQIVLVRGEAARHVARLGRDILDVNVIIPRPGSGTTVVGSSRSPGSWDTRPDEEVTRSLLEGGKRLVPELLDDKGEFDVIRPCVGLRPYRKGGPRVEIEKLMDGRNVIHAYGHAGAGYQNSIGSANKVLRLVRSLEGS